MSGYICKVCSSKDRGTFRFTLEWTKTREPPEATRCPRCGALESSQEIERL